MPSREQLVTAHSLPKPPNPLPITLLGSVGLFHDAYCVMSFASKRFKDE